MLAFFCFLFATSVLVVLAAKPVPPANPLLDPRTVPQFVNQLDGPPPIFVPDPGTTNNYTVSVVTGHMQQYLPAPLPATPVWAYSGQAKSAVTGASLGLVTNSPGCTFETIRGTPINVKWINEIPSTTVHMFPVDPSLHYANTSAMPSNIEPFQLMSALAGVAPAYPPGFDGQALQFTPPGTTTPMTIYFNAQSPVPIVTHLHGGEIAPQFDGGPEAWFTQNGIQGADYRTLDPTAPNAAIYQYANTQPAATLWYHDHALGMTRLNVMSGLAGFYLLRESSANPSSFDPMSTVFTGRYDMPLVIQDRTFYADGTLYFPTVGINPAMHPYWVPEFFGDTIMVNGEVWPNMNVESGWYRFRVLDGSNARFYTISLKVTSSPNAALIGTKVPFVQIGSDGGYISSPVTLKELTIAPGERADILIDFSALPAGTTILMENKAKAPFPAGAQPDPKTTGKIMQFTVTPLVSAPTIAAVQPALTLLTPNANFVSLLGTTATTTRYLTLVEIMGMAGPAEILLNGQRWDAVMTETPQLGTTEDWVIINPTADTHPIHLHLVQFQVVSRQSIDTAKYYADWVALQYANGLTPGVGLGAATPEPWPDTWVPYQLAPTAYLKGKVKAPPLNELGWKDTIQMNPGEVTIIRVRFSPVNNPINAPGTYAFDATAQPGYVWHCHIIDHEDNEMMRPYLLH